MRNWKTLTPQSRDAVVAARLELHHAAQIVSAAGRSYIPARDDDSHSAFEWLGDFDCLAGCALNNSGIRVGLRPAALELCVLGGAGVLASHGLASRTVDDAVRWLAGELSAWGLDATRFSLSRPYDLPPHALGSGGRFEFTHPAAFEDLARQWGNADLLLRELVAREPKASQVRCWPHHFDIATLSDEGGGRTIGVGLSPGDEIYPEPYFYVTPFPYPAAEVLPRLPFGGAWNKMPWVGAVLLSAKLISLSGADAQKSAAGGFLSSAMDACRALFR